MKASVVFFIIMASLASGCGPGSNPDSNSPLTPDEQKTLLNDLLMTVGNATGLPLPAGLQSTGFGGVTTAAAVKSIPADTTQTVHANCSASGSVSVSYTASPTSSSQPDGTFMASATMTLVFNQCVTSDGGTLDSAGLTFTYSLNGQHQESGGTSTGSFNYTLGIQGSLTYQNPGRNISTSEVMDLSTAMSFDYSVNQSAGQFSETESTHYWGTIDGQTVDETTSSNCTDTTGGC